VCAHSRLLRQILANERKIAAQRKTAAQDGDIGE